MEIRHPTSGMHYYQSLHQLFSNQHLPTNRFNMPAFSSSYKSITHHHQTTAESISTTLSEDQSYIKQHYFQRV
jgi:hypothetical protein